MSQDKPESKLPPYTPSTKAEELAETRRNIKVAARLIQMLFLAIFALGISLMAGDSSHAAKLPFSALSLDTTLFGALGVLISEITARRSQNW